MLEKINVISLFGRFNYAIEMKSTGVTIITGPNGYGKSTILKIIEAVWQKNINFFFHLDFKTISILCCNTQKFEIKRSVRGDKLTFSHNKISATVNSEDMEKMGRIPPFLRKIGPNRFRVIPGFRILIDFVRT